MEQRRRVPRQSSGWKGSCLIEGESTTVGWRDCKVVDISMLGLGVMFRHRRPSELIGRCISVEVPASADSLSIRLEGQVKNAAMTRSGTVRVGVEFVGLTQEELALAIALGALTAANKESVER
jgi:hypothetical protein